MYAALTLTSLVDLMTIIVIFLLMNFSANGEVLYMSGFGNINFAAFSREGAPPKTVTASR